MNEIEFLADTINVDVKEAYAWHVRMARIFIAQSRATTDQIGKRLLLTWASGRRLRALETLKGHALARNQELMLAPTNLSSRARKRNRRVLEGSKNNTQGMQFSLF